MPVEWSAELAYLVGLIVTDGSLSKDGRHIVIISSDKDLLEKISAHFLLKNKITISINNGYGKRPSYRLQIGNAALFHWLLSIGLFPNKTYTISKIIIPDKYFRDFLRGHLDGDGTILQYQDTYNVYKGHRYNNQRIYLKFVSASEKHIYWLYSKIFRLTSVTGSISCIKRENKAPI